MGFSSPATLVFPLSVDPPPCTFDLVLSCVSLAVELYDRMMLFEMRSSTFVLFIASLPLATSFLSLWTALLLSSLFSDRVSLY